MQKSDTLIHIFFHKFLKVVLVSCYQIVRMRKMCICFQIFLKSWDSFVPSNCLNAKKIHLECEIHNTPLSAHKQTSVFNTTYTIQSHVNCPSIVFTFLMFILLSFAYMLILLFVKILNFVFLMLKFSYCLYEVSVVYVVCRLIKRKSLNSYPRSVTKNEIW